MSVDTAMIAEMRRGELDALLVANGTVTPKAVVDFARNPDTALHSVFEWDDSTAGERFREIQASQYIRSVAKVMPVAGSDEPMRVRAFVSLSRDRGTGAYRPVEAVLADPEMYREMLSEAESEFKAFRTKYQHVKQLTRLFVVAESVFKEAA